MPRGGDRRVSSREVARRAGVSIATVSFVLNGKTKETRIPPETEARVLHAARELGYFPNRLASSLLTGRSHTLGIIVPSIGDSSSSEMVEGIQETGGPLGYRVLLTRSLWDPATEREQAEFLLQQRVDGIICFVNSRTYPHAHHWLELVQAAGVPCAIASFFDPQLPVDCFFWDQQESARQAVKHLIGLGHRRIGHVAGGRESRVATLRELGFLEAMGQAEVADAEALVVPDAFNLEEVRKGIAALLDRSRPPSALLMANDDAAIVALGWAAERGMRIPDDFAVMGFGGLGLTEALRLTTMREDARELGRRIAARVLQRLDEPTLPVEHVTLPVRLLVRRSCGAREG